MVLKTCSIESDDIIMTLTDQSGRPWEIEDNWNCLVINANDTFCKTKNKKIRQKIYIFGEIHVTNSEEKKLNAATKAGLDAVKIASNV